MGGVGHWPLLPVEVVSSALHDSNRDAGCVGVLVVESWSGRRVEVHRGSDLPTLERFLTTLEMGQAAFVFGPATRIYVAPGATDVRNGFNGLYGLVPDTMECDPVSGHVHLLANARRNRLKPVVYDGSGLWVCAKQLDGGRARWPARDSAVKKVALRPEYLVLLLAN
jgi:transposase